ncbi:MAG: MaoC family dehydratase [Euryarchaeota archaeon]|nr:MaoC family dehydratase [Euryarchaeota archaeon]
MASPSPLPTPLEGRHSTPASAPPERLFEKGRYFEEFKVGAVFAHHWGRTISEAEAIQFATQTMNYNPLYFNRVYARSLGHPDVAVCPWLVFNIILGMSVEDISEQATALLGYGDMTFHRPVYPGDTLTAESEVVETRESKSKPDQGILTVRTRARNQKGELVLDYQRSNLIRRRKP